MRKLGVVLVVCAAACSSDPETNNRTFNDVSGRMCAVDLSQASMIATCSNADPATTETMCQQGYTPCFQLLLQTVGDMAVTPMMTAPEICAGCCNSAAHQSLVDAPTCSPLKCTTTADCFFTTSTCQNGVCT
jgi:hypothetical protein